MCHKLKRCIGHLIHLGPSQEFPVADFDLEARVGERKVARSIATQGGDAEALGLENIEEPLLYDLFGVDQHFGGLSGGHYTVSFLEHHKNWARFRGRVPKGSM